MEIAIFSNHFVVGSISKTDFAQPGNLKTGLING